MNTGQVNKEFFKLYEEDRDTVIHMTIGGLRANHEQEVNDVMERMINHVKARK